MHWSPDGTDKMADSYMWPGVAAGAHRMRTSTGAVNIPGRSTGAWWWAAHWVDTQCVCVCAWWTDATLADLPTGCMQSHWLHQTEKNVVWKQQTCSGRTKETKTILFVLFFWIHSTNFISFLIQCELSSGLQVPYLQTDGILWEITIYSYYTEINCQNSLMSRVM